MAEWLVHVVRSASHRLTSGHAAVIAGAAATSSALIGLGSQPLSWDEAVSLNAAHRPIGPLWTLLRHTDAPLGAYYAGLHMWLRIGQVLDVPPAAVWIRLPSALAMIAAVTVTTLIACRSLGPHTGLVCGALMSVHPLVVFYAHDARPYAITMLLAVIATKLILDDLRSPRRWTLWAYGVVAVIMVYAQLWSLFVVAAHAIVGLVRTRRWRYAIVVAAVIAAVIPLVVLGAGQTGEVTWIAAPSVASVLGFLARLGGGVAVVAAAVAVLCAGRTGEPWRGDDALVIRLWLCLPPAGLILLSVWQPMLVPRYALVCVPAWVIAVAAAIRRLSRRAAFAVGAAMIVAGLLATGLQTARPYKYEDFRAAADAVLDSAAPGDGIVYVPSSYRVGLAPYFRPDADDHGVPVDIALASPASLRSGATIGGTQVKAPVVAARILDRRRIYVVGNVVGADPMPSWQVGFVTVWRRSFGDVSVTLLRRVTYSGAAGEVVLHDAHDLCLTRRFQRRLR